MLIPTVKWAQRPGVVYLTIDVQDSKDPQIELTNADDGANGHLVFKATASGADEDAAYQLDLVLFGGVDKERSKISVTPRSVFLVIEKAEEGSWPRLTKETGKHLTHIKVDWDKWVDSDDEGDDAFDPSAMGGLESLGGGGFGGMPGMMGGGMPPGMGGFGGGMAGLESMLGGLGGGGMGGGGGLPPGMDFSGMDMGGAGAGEGDTAGVDSDDEDLPDLEA